MRLRSIYLNFIRVRRHFDVHYHHYHCFDTNIVVMVIIFCYHHAITSFTFTSSSRQPNQHLYPAGRNEGCSGGSLTSRSSLTIIAPCAFTHSFGVPFAQLTVPLSLFWEGGEGALMALHHYQARLNIKASATQKQTAKVRKLEEGSLSFSLTHVQLVFTLLLSSSLLLSALSHSAPRSSLIIHHNF